MRKALNAIRIAGREVLPLVEGGKGISVSTGVTAGLWAALGGIGTVSAVNADSYDVNGAPVLQLYHEKSRVARHRGLVNYAIKGGIAQAKIARELAGRHGMVNANILWEMAASEEVITGVLAGAKGAINGITCGAGMPYRLSELAAAFGVYYFPIVSSARAFSALWKRSYHKNPDLLGGVVYEDPWRAGGHNGLSNSENPQSPEDPYPRVLALRQTMRSFGLHETPVIMAGGVWWLDEWEDWIDNKELGPIAFQFGTRPLLTQESPIGKAWKEKLLTLKKGDIFLNRFSPTGFYSSAVNNRFLQDIQARNNRQVAYSRMDDGVKNTPFHVGGRGRQVFLTPEEAVSAQNFVKEGYSEVLYTPDTTLVFVTPEEKDQILTDQVNCMGCLSQCRFSGWSQQAPAYSTGFKPDPRSFCIQKVLQNAAHLSDNKEITENNLLFSGHNGFRFGEDPFYENGFIPTVRELVERILTGR